MTEAAKKQIAKDIIAILFSNNHYTYKELRECEDDVEGIARGIIYNLIPGNTREDHKMQNHMMDKFDGIYSNIQVFLIEYNKYKNT